jgi:hypothetical protein
MIWLMILQQHSHGQKIILNNMVVIQIMYPLYLHLIHFFNSLFIFNYIYFVGHSAGAHLGSLAILRHSQNSKEKGGKNLFFEIHHLLFY